MRTLIIHNTKSGFGSDAIFQFERALACEGDEITMRLLDDDPDDGHDPLADVDDFDLVVLSGGDGTVANLLYQLRGSEVPVCVFPSGTANLFFANLGNAPEPASIARACRIGRTVAVDLGEISWKDPEGGWHTRGFTLMSGTGFDAKIMEAALPNKTAMGEAAYFAAALSNPHPEVDTFKITVDGETYEREGISCMVANNAMIQGEIQIVPDCRMDDGMLDVIVLETTDVAQLITPLVFGLVDHEGKSIGRPHIEGFRGHEIRVEASSPMPFEYDGETVESGCVSYEAHVLEGVVHIIVDEMSPYAADAPAPEEPLFGNAEVMPYPEV